MSQAISKTMLIVKSDANSLKGVEQFLKNREWNIVSTNDMKKAIGTLVTMKPSFVLITVDHPSKKMAKFPKIVNSAFQTCVMMFAEKSTTASFKALMDSGIDYRINPPVTGPAIERAVNKYLRDLETAAKIKETGTIGGDEKSNFDFSVEVKSGEQKKDGFVTMTASSSSTEGEADPMMKSLLAQLANDDDSDENSGIAFTPVHEQGPKAAKSGIAHAGSLQTPGPSTDAEDGLFIPTQEKNKKESKAHEIESTSVDTMMYNPDGTLKKGQDVMIGRAKTQNGAGYDPGENVSGKNQQPDYDPSKPSESLIIGQSGNEKKKNKSSLSQDVTKVKEGGIFNDESVFVKGVNQSLDSTVVKGSGETQTYLEDNSHLACIVVESPKFSGYLVAALGKDKKIDDEFVELVRSKLMKFLRDAGEPIDNEANMQVKVKRVDFEGWALEYAQFLRKSVHKGDEVAMAFFPFAEAQTKVGISAKENMVSVKTVEIEAGKPLEFNMYIYLPTNKKYILYTPQGAVFQEVQKDRLIRQGVGEIHIQKQDVQNLSKYKAQNHLNSLIDKYETKGSEKSEPKKKAS